MSGRERRAAGEGRPAGVAGAHQPHRREPARPGRRRRTSRTSSARAGPSPRSRRTADGGSLDRTSSPGRPARRRPLREPARPPGAASTGASASSASSSSSSSCSSAARPSRSRRRRSTSRRSRRTSRRTTVALPAHRGSILDRNGDELAVGKPQQTVVRRSAPPGRPACRGGRALRRAADQPPQGAPGRRGRAGRRQEAKSWFAYVARKVDPELARAALALDLPGVVSYTEEERTYPLKATAAQVLGFAGTENKGLAGIELLYDKELSGKAGSETVVRDPAGHALKTVAHQEPTSGQNVRLTLDSEIQYYAEDVLEKTVRDTGAKAATAIVMDPRTGEVLAMANVTREGFHGFGKGDQAAEKNRAVTDVYEPGSIFKLVTISGALADGIVTPTRSSRCRPAPRGRPRDQRVAPARHGELLGARDPAAVQQRGRRDDRHEDGQGRASPSGSRPSASASRPASSSPARRAASSAGGAVVGLLDRQHPHGAGHRRDAHPDGRGVLRPSPTTAWQVRPRLVAQVGTEVYDEAREAPGDPRPRWRARCATCSRWPSPRAPAPRRRSPATRSPARPAPPRCRARGRLLQGRLRGLVHRHGARPTIRGWSSWSPSTSRTAMYGGEVAAPAVQKIMRFALQHLEIAP